MRLGFFLLGFITMTGWLVLLNSPHLGVNASLHWDAEASITYGPAVPDRAGLADARAHLYDVLPLVHSNDPARITDYFWKAPGSLHIGLTLCRYYYSYVSDWIGHQAFLLGQRWFRSPVGAIWCYQLCATVITSLALSAMLLFVVVRLQPGHRLGIRLAIIVLTFATISSSPVMLSLARQMLTETSGFAFLVATILSTLAIANTGRRIKIETDDRRGRFSDHALPPNSVVAEVTTPEGKFGLAISAIAAGMFCFLTIRARYTLGPALVMLLPVVLLLNFPLSQWRWRTFRIVAIAFAVPFVLLVAVDIHWFGPFFFPWVYDDVMVRSSKLLFHADPPYEDFIIAVFVNLPAMLVPLIGVWCWLDHPEISDGVVSPRQTRWCKLLAALILLILAVMLWRTAAQQVKFQGRHLFVFLATATMLLLLVLPRIRWRGWSMGLYVLVTGFVLVWNCCSTFGPQRLHTMRYQADFVTVVTDHLSSAGATAKKSLAGDVWNSYFDWADDRLLRDSLLTWTYVDRHRQPGALLLLDAAAEKTNQFNFYAKEFPAFGTCQMHGRCDPIAMAAARTAIARRQNVFLFTAPGRRPPDGVMDTEAITDLNLKSDALRKVVQIAPAAVYLDSGAATTAAADGLTLSLVRGKSGWFDAGYGWLPRVQQEYMSYDSDPHRVVYEATGLQPGVQYELGFVTWDADKLGRAMSVSAESSSVKTELLSSEPIRRNAAAGLAPIDTRVLLPITERAGPMRIAFENQSTTADAVVCEIWIRQVQASKAVGRQ